MGYELVQAVERGRSERFELLHRRRIRLSACSFERDPVERFYRALPAHDLVNAPADAVFTVEVQKLDGADGKTLFSSSDFTDYDAERLAKLTAESSNA